MGSPVPAQLLLVYTLVAVYAISYMAQVPLLPYLVKELGAQGSAQYGALQTLFSAAQLIGGLVSGPLADRFGGRWLLQVSFLASAACYAMAASSTSLTMLYLSRVPTVLQHAVLAARTIVAAQSAGEGERARLLGYVGVAYGVGFAAGPAIGGLMSSISLRFAAWAAAAASLGAWAVVLLLVPDDSPARAGKAAAGEGSKAAAAAPKPGLLQATQVLRDAGVRRLLVTKVLSGLAFGLLQAVFSPLLQRAYGLGARENGMVLSYLGVVTIAAQAALVGPAQRKLGGGRATVWGCWAMAASFLAMGAARHLPVLLASLLPMCGAGLVVATINTAQLTQAVPKSQVGSVLALDMSLGSGLRMLTPAAGMLLLEKGGSQAVGATCASLVLGLLGMLQLGIAAAELPPRVRAVEGEGEKAGDAGQEQEGKKEK